MKTIKFRQPIRDRDGKFIEWFYWGFIDGDFITPALQSNGLETRPESQQFTGLLDKNGKEIYEGDIVTALYEWETYDGDAVADHSTIDKGAVVFSGGQWCVDGKVMPLYQWDNKTLEVIGNVHQNPELL